MSDLAHGKRVVPIGGPQEDDEPRRGLSIGGCFRTLFKIVLWVTLPFIAGCVGYLAGANSENVSLQVPAEVREAIAVPTAIPTPEPTLVPAPECPTAAETEYAETVENAMKPFRETAGALGTLFTQSGENPTLYLDDNWKAKVAVHMAILKVLGAEIGGLVAPSERTKAAQDQLASMADSISLAVAAYAKGIENLDADAMQEGTTLILAAAQNMHSSAALLEGMCG